MSSFNIEDVKKLREATSAGIADCKKALAANNGDFEAAKDWLKQKGLLIANKKADRVAAEGLLAVNNAVKKATVIEVNSETDFVAKNQDFINFVSQVSDISINYNDLEDLKDADYGNNNTVSAELLALISKVQENLILRKLLVLSAKEGKLYHYVHAKSADNMGRIIVVVNIKGSGDLSDLGKGIAMHIAGFNPLAISSEQLPQQLVQKEQRLIEEELSNVSKPQEVIQRMLKGKMDKFFKEVCLLDQNYLLDDKKTVREKLQESGAEILSYTYVALGEDVEKQEENFANEVSKIISG